MSGTRDDNSLNVSAAISSEAEDPMRWWRMWSQTVTSAVPMLSPAAALAPPNS